MKIILASKSGVRKKILDKYKIANEVKISNVDEDEIKESLLVEGADPLEISKNLAEIKSIQVSNKNPDRLADIRRNRVAIMKDRNLKEYTDLKFIKEEVENSKKLFKKNNWPIIDVTRRSVEETAASILKIIEIKKNK